MSERFTAKEPTEETVLEAATVSAAIYNDDINVAGYELFYHHVDSPDDYRVANWCIYISNDWTKLFIVFRGSHTFIDWLQNFSFSPAKHPQFPNVKLHSGYYHEVDNEYDTFKEKIAALNSKYDLTRLEKVVITGHSKGGGLAQLLTDKIFNDGEFHRTYPHTCSALTCVTFSAPLVFWFQQIEHVTEVKSAYLFHNYIIKGDPVPVLQLLLCSNREAFNRMVESELAKKTVFSGAAVGALGVEGLVNKLVPFVKGFLPVGAVFYANITQLGDHSGVEFISADFNIAQLDCWICVRDEFGVDYHTITNHVGVAKNCYDEYLERLRTNRVVENPKQFGLYVQNNTNVDILFVMSYLNTAVHWARVPHHKTVHVGSQFFFHIKASRYEEKNVPTKKGVVGQIIMATNVLTHIYAAGAHALSSSKDNLANVWCNGRTVVVDSGAVVNGVPQLEITLKDTEAQISPCPATIEGVEGATRPRHDEF